MSLVHLNASGTELLCYWPDPGCPLALYSAERLPHWTVLSRRVEQTGSTLVRLSAHSGDVLLALAGEAWTRFPDPTYGLDSGPLLAALANGGPATCDYLMRVLKAGAEPASGVILEVR